MTIAVVVLAILAVAAAYLGWRDAYGGTDLEESDVWESDVWE